MESSTTTSADIQNGSLSVFELIYFFYLSSRKFLQAVESDCVPRVSKTDSKSTTRRPLTHDKRSGFEISKLICLFFLSLFFFFQLDHHLLTMNPIQCQ